MAEYKLGDLVFETEQEYNNAASDLKRIKSLMAEYNVNKPEEAKKVLERLSEEPAFNSEYGIKFLEKLEKTANIRRETTTQNPVKSDKVKKTARKKSQKGIHIITKRNVIIGVFILILLVVVKLATGISFTKDETTEVKRRMILTYAQTQIDLKGELRDYYRKVDGLDSDTALDRADTFLTENYVLNLSNEKVYELEDKEITELYVKLLTGGDLDAAGFNEPLAVTNIKTEIGKVLTSGIKPETEEDEMVVDKDSISSVVNEMMSYQYKVYTQLTNGYSKLHLKGEEVRQMAEDDLEMMFGHVIYDSILNESEKEAYYSDFVNRGLINGNKIVKIGSSPEKAFLPDLNPKIDLSLPNGNYTAKCIQVSPSVGASVAYEIDANSMDGAIVFRNNGDNTKYIQTADDTSVTLQGDVFIYIGGTLVYGEWYYDNDKIGLFIEDEKGYSITNIYELSF